jgi:large subunit ribosomal protein L10
VLLSSSLEPACVRALFVQETTTVNRDQKAAVIDSIAGQLESAEAVFAIDYRGLSVKQAVDLRTSLTEADATFQVAKNTLTERAADRAGADTIKPLLEGPTALTFVNGDVALAAKALATFRRQNNVLEFKGGHMNGEPLSPEQIESIARLPTRDVLNALISGLAIQLGAIAEQGLVGGGGAAAEPASEAPASDEAPAEAEAEAPAPEVAAEEARADEAEADAAPADTEADAAPADTEDTPSEAPGDPVAEGEAAEQTSETGTEEG